MDQTEARKTQKRKNDKDTLRQRNKVKYDMKRKQPRIIYRNVYVEANDVKYD